MTINIGEIATNLEPSKNGIWFSKNQSQISYPEDGNIRCHEIEDHSFWFKHRNRCITEIIRLYPPNGTLFDIGVGNGFVSQAIKRLGLSTIVIEPGLEGAMNAIDRGLTPVICATVQDAGFKSHTIPGFCLFDIIEHIEDDRAFINTLKTLLFRDGRLYITVPAYNALWSIHDDHAGHYRRYNLKSLTMMLKSLDFRIDFKTYIFSVLPLPVFLFRTLPSKLKLKKEVDFEHTKKEHSQNRGIFSLLLNRILEEEVKILKIKRTIPFGGSCLVVATSCC